MSGVDHSFVVPAYGHSPHIRECLDSLLCQTRPGSEIVVSTSTPTDSLAELTETYGISLNVHGPNAGIGRDWNAALDAATRRWVTIAHQDDVYLPDFVARTMAIAAERPDVALVATDYFELMGGRARERTMMLRIKAALVELAFLGRREIAGSAAKTRLLRFGCPIACPSVTLGPKLSGLRFREDLKVDLDWEAWIRAARLPGTFCYLRERLMMHRIHEGSETSAGVRDGARAREDAEMFRSLWPTAIAKVLARAYAWSYEDVGRA